MDTKEHAEHWIKEFRRQQYRTAPHTIKWYALQKLIAEQARTWRTVASLKAVK